MKRPSTKDWKRLCASLIETEDPAATSGVTGLPLPLVKHAWLRGWPGDPKAKVEPLPPIRDLAAQAAIHGENLTPVLTKAITEEQRRAIAEALADGTARKALEGLVSDQMLAICERTMAAGVKLADATTRLAEHMAGSIDEAIQSGEMKPSDAHRTLRTVASYLQKVSEVAEAYSRMRERAVAMEARQAPSERFVVEEGAMMERLHAILNTIDTMRRAKDALVVADATPQDAPLIPTTSEPRNGD